MARRKQLPESVEKMRAMKRKQMFKLQARKKARLNLLNSPPFKNMPKLTLEELTRK